MTSRTEDKQNNSSKDSTENGYGPCHDSKLDDQNVKGIFSVVFDEKGQSPSSPRTVDRPAFIKAICTNYSKQMFDNDPTKLEKSAVGYSELLSNSCGKDKFTSPLPCGNGRDVSNLVQFVNSASNDIKEAMDKSSSLSSIDKESTLTTIANSSSSSLTHVEPVREDKLKSYFNSRDSSAMHPLKILKVEPLNIVKPGSKTSDDEKNCRCEKVSNEVCYDIPPIKRIKVSTDNPNCKLEVSKGTPVSNTIHVHANSCSEHTCKDIIRNENKASCANPLPLRKRRLPASFWQEPGKSDSQQPRHSVATPPRHTAFLPIAPRQSPYFGRYVKEFLGSNLSASEKLELLRLNSIERENFNHLCSARDVYEKRCPNYPCVLMHCKNQHEDMRVRDFPGLHPRNECFFNSPASVPRSNCIPFTASHHERLTNVLGMTYPGTNYLPDMFRHDDVIDSSYGSRLILPMEYGSPYFPLIPQFHHSVVRPVPKKHLNNISSHFHPTFDMR